VTNEIDLHACCNGDKAAWDAFVDRCTGVIHAAVRRTQGTGGPSVEDAIQEVFVRLVKDDYRLLRSFDPGKASLTTWLTIIARSTTIDGLRRRRLETVGMPTSDIAQPEPTRPVGIDPPPLHLLTDRQQLVLTMLFDQEMAVTQVAAVLQVDEQTIRSTKHKALSRLRDHFTGSGKGGSEVVSGADSDRDPQKPSGESSDPSSGGCTGAESRTTEGR